VGPSPAGLLNGKLSGGELSPSASLSFFMTGKNSLEDKCACLREREQRAERHLLFFLVYHGASLHKLLYLCL